jgi:hypothetical protein
MVVLRIAQIVALFALAESSERALLSTRAGNKDCEADYDSLTHGDLCTTTWKKLTESSTHLLRPTEPSVGHSYVVYQMNDDFYSMAKATKWLGKKTFPVVLYDNDFYLTDRHHHALALQLTGDASMWDIEMTVEVADDYRTGLSGDFWTTMESHGYAFLHSVDDSKHDSPLVRIDTTTMPRNWNLANYADNIWRSLAGFSTHDEPEDQRCYLKACTYFIDFAWGHMFLEATYRDTAVWGNLDGTAFRLLVESLPQRPAVGDVDLDRWFAISRELLPLCHSESVRNYPLPEGFPSSTLEGWSTVPMPDDPDCMSAETVV